MEESYVWEHTSQSVKEGYGEEERERKNKKQKTLKCIGKPQNDNLDFWSWGLRADRLSGVIRLFPESLVW